MARGKKAAWKELEFELAQKIVRAAVYEILLKTEKAYWVERRRLLEVAREAIIDAR